MVIKFDHVSYITSRADKEAILQREGKPVFYEENLENLVIKKGFMKKPMDDHDLYFYGDRDLPLEYIFYDEVSNESAIEINEGKIQGRYSDKNQAVSFLQSIFGKKAICLAEQDVIRCNMRGILDKQDYWLELEPAAGTEAYLDDKGYGAITVITNSKTFVVPSGCRCTEYEKLIVNNKELNICFMSSAAVNIIFELILFVR